MPAFSSLMASFTASVYLFPVAADLSSTLQTYITGLFVSRKRSLAMASSSWFWRGTLLQGRPWSRASWYLWRSESIFAASLSPLMRACFSTFPILDSTVSRSLICSSASTTSLSLTGSTLPSTCTTLSSSKQRSTWRMASVSLMFARNWLPSPSPLLAPLTRPAMSTMSTVAGMTLCGLQMSARTSSRLSGTFVDPRLGSMVQKGKLALWALPELMQLKRVDLPTLGSPTIPHLRDISS